MKSEESNEKVTQLWDYEDVSKYLKRSKSQLRHDVMFKRIPHIRIGGSIRFSKDQIDQWLKSLEVKARPSSLMRNFIERTRS